MSNTTEACIASKWVEFKVKEDETIKIDKNKLEFKPSTIIEGWIDNFESTKTWITKLQKKKHSAMWLYYFCSWAETDPDKLLALKDDPSDTEAEIILDKFVADKETGLTHSEKYNIATVVRSFFKHNYKDLAKAAGAIAFEKKRPYWTPNKEDLRKLYRACFNPRDRAMLAFICSSAIAKGTLAGLTWKHMEDRWEEQECPHISISDKLLKGHGRGKYKGMRQETFLTPEAKRDLTEYKDWIEKKQGRQFAEEDHIFVELKEPFRPLSYDRIGGVFDEMSERAGIKFSPHDARRFVETTLEECRIHPNWARKIRGRKVRGEESPYSRPEIEKLREFYGKEAAPKLQFLTAPPHISEEDRRIQATFDNLRLAGFSEDEIENLLEQRGKTWKTARDLIGIARSRRAKAQTEFNGGSRACNGHNCQRIVREEELPSLLAQGWRVSATLPSGKVVVEKNGS